MSCAAWASNLDGSMGLQWAARCLQSRLPFDLCNTGLRTTERQKILWKTSCSQIGSVEQHQAQLQHDALSWHARCIFLPGLSDCVHKPGHTTRASVDAQSNLASARAAHFQSKCLMLPLLLQRPYTSDDCRWQVGPLSNEEISLQDMRVHQALTFRNYFSLRATMMLRAQCLSRCF